MALRRSESLAAWTAPRWPAHAHAAQVGSVAFDPVADELVVRFAGAEDRPETVEPLVVPRFPCANVIVDERGGEVIGVQIDSLVHAAVVRFPHWAPAAGAAPPAAVLDRLVADVRALFEQYGVGGAEWPGRVGG